MATANVNNVINFGGATNSTNPAATIPVSDYSKIVTLVTKQVTGGNYSAFGSMGAPTTNNIYTVPSGKTWVGYGFWLANGAGGLAYQFGYGTATFTHDQAGAPTGAIYYSPSTTTLVFLRTAATEMIWVPCLLRFPALSFPFLRVDTANTYLQFVGEEI